MAPKLSPPPCRRVVMHGTAQRERACNTSRCAGERPASLQCKRARRGREERRARPQVKRCVRQRPRLARQRSLCAAARARLARISRPPAAVAAAGARTACQGRRRAARAGNPACGRFTTRAWGGGTTASSLIDEGGLLLLEC